LSRVFSCCRRLTLGLSVAALALSAGCATPPPADDPEAVAAFHEANDPYEPFNRAVFEVNLLLDKVLLKPLAFVYKEAVPGVFQDMIRNVLNHMRTPVTLANDLLQGEWDRAGATAMRIALNTTIGVVGIADPATEMGFPAHEEDFGQTMAVAGVRDGPYLMLPLLGPSNPRDGVGFLVDFAFDPFTYLDVPFAFTAARFGTRQVDFRARAYDAINELERTSLDYYATVRSLYRQRRADEIRNGQTTTTQPMRSSMRSSLMLFDEPDRKTGVPGAIKTE
jgi:phospholipid-binding lipoprotein MlaA